ncbi:sigma-70 family RNA polymerase sigma factor [Mucilaginibacter sp. McL0603]|uniref:sigma-70 family RNA polymerase sigma factor n=1 Tax=Mucilaginibacter sp. McL0603 TaxID=3415670 RepID=UPI003CEBBB0F
MKRLSISQSITPRDFQSLDKYFNEIEKINLISPEEEVTLARRVKEGDQEALARLTKTNLRFVISIAKQYQNYGLTLGDLINEGNIGLIMAGKRYDETKGFKFISYAVWWIRQSIISAIAEHARMVRLPYNQSRLSSKLYKAACSLEQVHGRRPSLEELAEQLETPVEKIAESLSKSNPHISLNESFEENDDHTLLDVLQSNEPLADSGLIRDSIVKEIHYSLNVLCKRERELIKMFFGLGSTTPMSLEEIGNYLNITKEHVGRLKEKALHKLRHSSHANILKSCL